MNSKGKIFTYHPAKGNPFMTNLYCTLQLLLKHFFDENLFFKLILFKVCLSITEPEMYHRT